MLWMVRLNGFADAVRTHARRKFAEVEDLTPDERILVDRMAETVDAMLAVYPGYTPVSLSVGCAAPEEEVTPEGPPNFLLTILPMPSFLCM